MAIQPKKHSMPVQQPEIRAYNFKEVALGYSEQTAVAEAQRCLNCKNKPCVEGCPVNISIPDFITKIKQSDFEGAYEVITKSSSLPAVCGRVCPQETQCESKCTLGIKFEPVGIGRLERFVADYHNANFKGNLVIPEFNGHRVAVVGSGPSGLTCAGELAKKGYKVTVFEALHLAGGVLVYGIPEFRLPKAIVQKEVETLKSYGVEFETNVIIGKTITVDELFEDGYEAVFIGSGAGLPRFMGIPGESLKGVYSANEFLTRANLMRAYESDAQTPVMLAKNVPEVGGGNVAMDAARTALRLGAENVYIVYRRSMEELPARREEVEHAGEEGIKFEILRNPVELIGYSNPDDKRDPKNGFVTGMKVIKCKLGEPDEKGRRRPVEIAGSEYVIPVDCVIMSIGTSPNPLIKNTTSGLDVNKHGGIIVEETTGESSKENVYAGGDAVTGAATVILAMGAGKTAAKAIDQKLSNISKTNAHNKNMIIVNEIYEAFDYSEKIVVYNDNKTCTYNPSQTKYNEIMELWNKMLDGSHPMPALGVSINDYSLRVREQGLWVEFVFDEAVECYGMPFEKLLINVNKDFYGFNLIRYTNEHGYDGRCYYIDLVGKNMNEFYDYLLNVKH